MAEIQEKVEQPEPNWITGWINIDGLGLYKPGTRGKEPGLKYCEEVVAAINRHPDRRGEVEHHKILPKCRVVDYSRPIRTQDQKSDKELNLIIGWEPMDGHE